jgi:prevent-host-death family protein
VAGLLNLPERLARVPAHAVTITRRGRPVLAVMPWEFYESIVETLDVLSDPEMVLALREHRDLKHGRRVSHAEAKKRLGDDRLRSHDQVDGEGPSTPRPSQIKGSGGPIGRIFWNLGPGGHSPYR